VLLPSRRESSLSSPFVQQEVALVSPACEGHHPPPSTSHRRARRPRAVPQVGPAGKDDDARLSLLHDQIRQSAAGSPICLSSPVLLVFLVIALGLRRRRPQEPIDGSGRLALLLLVPGQHEGEAAAASHGPQGAGERRPPAAGGEGRVEKDNVSPAGGKQAHHVGVARAPDAPGGRGDDNNVAPRRHAPGQACVGLGVVGCLSRLSNYQGSSRPGGVVDSEPE